MAKKKKIVPSKAKDSQSDRSSIKKVVATQSKRGTSKEAVTATSETLVFNKENYKWVAIGIALITLGMLLMMGGFNENPTTWDEGEIYSFRRTLLAPIVILAGLGVEIYAIFK